MKTDNLHISPISHRTWGILPAAGVGARMQAACPKQYLPLLASTVIETTLQRLLNFNSQYETLNIQWYVGVSDDDEYWPGINLANHSQINTYSGGKERVDTVLNGLNALSGIANDDDWVLVHDAARPCFRQGDIKRLFDLLSSSCSGGILAVPVIDTLKKASLKKKQKASLRKNQKASLRKNIDKTVDRGQFWLAQTPQMFRYAELKGAIESALNAGVVITDEASAMEFMGYECQLVEGHSDNFKITKPGDVELASFYLQQIDPDFCFTQVGLSKKDIV